MYFVYLLNVKGKGLKPSIFIGRPMEDVESCLGHYMDCGKIVHMPHPDEYLRVGSVRMEFNLGGLGLALGSLRKRNLCGFQPIDEFYN